MNFNQIVEIIEYYYLDNHNLHDDRMEQAIKELKSMKCLTNEECKALDEFFLKCGFVHPDYTIIHSLIRQLREMMNDVHNEPSGIR